MSASEEPTKANNVCDACGAVVEGGKAGCMTLFETILAREFSDYRYGKIHRLTVDAYSLQHSEEYMRSGKSFAAHLTGAYAALASDDASSINHTVQKWLSKNPEIEKPPQLPRQRGSLTIAFIHNATDVDEHIERVREWAHDVWDAWSEHHALAKQLIDRALRMRN